MNRIETFAGGIVIGMILGSYIIGMAVEAQTISTKNGGMGITVSLSDSNMRRLERAIVITGLASNPNIHAASYRIDGFDRIPKLAQDLGY